ncbi:putative polysaccharide biosynthesis protein [Alkalihalobacterium elongatum]|uniref:putative polysaccharide biosynthesis protein n=1 Tax=Alkalihalobacterium elongatum TaxID=2675466 RepID=UPI001C1F77E0|nr:polysaccharide biosynthesis protein [Alkalihalobacterium elongatum]
MSSNRDQTKRIWQGALILTFAALITKVLSAVYRIPYQNIAGDIGFYVYQQVYPFYAIAFTLAIYGFPVIISKELSNREKNNDQELLSTYFYSLSLISTVVGLFLFILAEPLARWMGDPLLTGPLRVTALTYFVVPILSVFRGYFQGQGWMTPTAVSQLTDQSVRVVFILVLAYVMIIGGYGPYGAGLGAAIGSVLGALAGAMCLLLYFWKNNKGKRISFRLGKVKKNYIFPFIKNSVLFSLTILVIVFIQLIDSLTVLRLLIESGVYAEVAKASKGIFDRGQPLIQLGTIIATSFALTIVPMISRAKQLKDNIEAKRKTELTLRLTLVFGILASVGLAIIIAPTNHLLFTNREGSDVLFVLAFAILFGALVMTTAAVLQGYDKGHVAARHILIGLLTKGIGNVLLIPTLGTLGAAISTTLCLAVIACLNIIMIYKMDGAVPMQVRQLLGVIMTVIIMGAVTLMWRMLLEYMIFAGELSRTVDGVIALSSVSVGAVTALYLIIKLNVFSEKEVSAIPFFAKLYNVINQRRDLS